MAGNNEPLLKKKVYFDNCPGCKQDRKNEASLGIPYKEFFYVWIVTLCTALPISSLFPFLYFMIKDLHVAKREEDIGFYAGFVGASFMVGRALTSLLWGMVADRYGRKPVIVLSIISVIIFNTLFGLSTSYWMTITTRLLLGLLNGLSGPIKAYSIEVCREEYQALGATLVSTAWGIGLIVGPAIGGYFAQPAEKYPEIFSQDSFFARFPYFLPCICISLFAVGVLIASVWLPIFSLWAVSGKRYGGLSFSTKDVGEILAISGLGLLLFQTLLYPPLEKLVGPINSLRLAAILSIPLLVAYPFMAKMSGIPLMLIVNLASVLKNTFSVTIVTGLFILQNIAVAQDQRGAANGIAVTTMSIFKAIAPAAGGAIFSWAQKRQHASFLPGDQMVFFILNVVEFIGLLLSFKPFLVQRCNN
uniref:Major facilitator superfamily (MFS) profile domain-containing protein n=1 Tax=Musa acuminata subsp. malaccensis TaxID=214687 RepID=A0A804JB78_MUSAM|nr:PREDICTED: protein ZINC INDUCED FACILITATOR-LIKE 1 isoform X4 [Musa acuminata subsp. malaccensis]